MSCKRILPAAWMLCCTCAFADTYIRQPSIDVLGYDITIEVTDASDLIAATTAIQIRIRNKSASGMWLDLEDMSVDKLRVGGVDRPFTARNGRLAFEFDRKYSSKETVLVEVRYHGKPQDGLLFGKNRYGRRVVFADNWPDRAHHWFPSIDHPSDKARVSFSITAPRKYTVVSNGLMKNKTALPDGREITKWLEARPIPTYCMVFGIAEFSVTRSVEGTVPLAWYAFPQDAEFVGRKPDRTASILAYFEKLIGPYPYKKLAQVESILRPGAMENSSAIFYSEALVRGAPFPEEIVAHEIAHQWFGNTVTEADWDHLWLSEGFATYLEALFYEHLDGPEALKKKMARNAETVAQYAPALTTPVVDPAQPDPAKKLTPLNYQKGAWVLHMLRGVLGDEIFFRGIRRYYRLYAERNASTQDFQRVMESVSGRDLGIFFRQWLYQPGWPEYHLLWHWNESAGELELTIRQAQPQGLFDMPVEIEVTAGNLKSVHKFRVNEARHAFRIPYTVKPSGVELDPNNRILKKAL